MNQKTIITNNLNLILENAQHINVDELKEVSVFYPEESLNSSILYYPINLLMSYRFNKEEYSLYTIKVENEKFIPEQENIKLVENSLKQEEILKINKTELKEKIKENEHFKPKGILKKLINEKKKEKKEKNSKKEKKKFK